MPPGMPLITGRVSRDRPQPLANPNLVTKSDMDRQLLQGSLMGMASIPGGIVGRSLLAGAFPGSGVLGAAGGEAAATMGAGRATGMSPKDAAIAGLLAGGVGGTVEGGLNMAGRLTGSTLSAPDSVVAETSRLSPQEQAGVMFRKAPEGAARGIGLDVMNKIQAANNAISPGRLTKMNIMKAAQNSGVRVPISDLSTAIDSGAADAEMAIGRANTMASARLRSLGDSLTKKFPTGDISPTEADAQLRAFQRDADMAAAKNNPFLAQTYRGLKDTLRKSFFSSVDTALPGSNIAQATKQASDYLSAVDTLDSFVSSKTPETFVRSLFGTDPAAESARAALQEFEKQTGTGGSIEREIHHLSLKKAWTAEETGRAFSMWRAIEKVIAKPLTKGLLISSQPAGQAAAAATAFQSAMGQKKENQ
jgi:hypothetical protein